MPPRASTGSGRSASGKPVRRTARLGHPTPVASGIRRHLAGLDGCRHKRLTVRRLASTRLWRPGALARFRKRLQRLGPQDAAGLCAQPHCPDHPWVTSHPEFYIPGSEGDLAQQPQNYIRMDTADGPDPGLRPRSLFFRLARHAAAQLRQSRLQEAMIGELLHRRPMRRRPLRHGHARPAGRLRAHLGRSLAAPGHPSSHVAKRSAERSHPDFRFMAEVYWDLEWTLQQQGFDYAYDKRLYDRLRERHARPVREHFHAGLDYQDKLDPLPGEPRRAAGRGHVSPDPSSRSRDHVSLARPAILPSGPVRGMSDRISPHLGRGPWKPTDCSCQNFTSGCWRLGRPVRDGQWQLLNAARLGRQSDPGAFVAFAWEGDAGQRLLTAVNYGPTQGQSDVELPPGWQGRDLRLH